MCIVCQTISMGAAALTGILPMATPEHYESPSAVPSAAVSAPLTATAPAATVPMPHNTPESVWRRAQLLIPILIPFRPLLSREVTRKLILVDCDLL